MEIEMEKSRERLEHGIDSDGELAVKRPRTLEMSDQNDDVGEDILAWLSMDEVTVGELMKLLDPETPSPITTTTNSKVRFIDNPYSSSLIFQSSSYVTINGNEESCGSSFSDSESSVMANIDMGGIFIGKNIMGIDGFGVSAEEGGAWISTDGVAREEMEAISDGMDGSDGIDWDDDVLAKFLGEDSVF